MRRLPRPVAALPQRLLALLFALLLSLHLPAAFADDEKEEPDCLKNVAGQIFCRPPGGGIKLDQIGQTVCGVGGCTKDHLGMVYCAIQAGAKAKFDKKTGRVDCQGACLPGSIVYCRMPLLPLPKPTQTP